MDDDFVPLIVMPQDQHPIAECLLGGPGPLKKFLSRDRLVIGDGKRRGFNGIHARTSVTQPFSLVYPLCSILRFA